ncbi:MAG: hypothetical protein Q4B85_02245 [Lachnospiraceae bacterium]|nr:hypothetical protein [Lachnospiraceae bacterium]
MRKVEIINRTTGNVDHVVYHLKSSVLYVNGIPVAQKAGSSNYLSYSGTTADGWTILGTNTHYVSWAQSTAVVVAAAIGSVIAQKASVIIASMGMAAISALADCCSGGTLYYELHMYSTASVLPQYRYKWIFTANTGDVYGPYYTPV